MSNELFKNRSYVPGLSESDTTDFERVAAELLRAYEKRPENEPIAPSRWQPQRVPRLRTTEENIVGPLIVQEPDPATFEIKSIRLGTEAGIFGLEEVGCRLLDDLSERWINHPKLRGLSTHKAMRNRLIDWSITVLESGRFSPCVEYILSHLRKEVKCHEVWVKLADIDVQDRLSMGAVEIVGISPDQIQAWMKRMIQAGLTETEEKNIRTALEKEWQGETAAVYKGIGDILAVEDSAFEHAERACAMLRMVDPGNLSAIQRSYLQPLTLVSQMGIRAILTDPETVEFARSTHAVDAPPCGLVIEKEEFNKLWEKGYLQQFHELLTADPPTPFQAHLVTAILIYSRHRLTGDPIEKLIFAFTGLETTLLGADKSVRIRSTLKRRFGIALGNSEKEKADLAKLVNDAYNLRSEYLHHGITLHDQHLIQQFLLHSWAYFLRVIENHSRWRTIGDYCSKLDASP